MNGNKWVQWVIGILITIALAFSGYAINRIDTKVDKEQYRCDIVRIEKSLEKIDEKMDRFLERSAIIKRPSIAYENKNKEENK